MSAMETWNQTLVFTLNALNKRTKISRDGQLELEEIRVGTDMLSKWAAVKAFDPDKMNTKDVIVALSTNVSNQRNYFSTSKQGDSLQVFAGSDTTAIALRTILYFLMKNPDKMRKLRQEVDDAYKAGKISDMVRDEEARNELPYLDLVIKESLRLHPSVGEYRDHDFRPRYAIVNSSPSRDPGFLFERHVPAGTIVSINAWVLQHDPEVFPNPESFEPERWSESEHSKEELANTEKHFFSFGADSRVCIGRNISYIEMRKIIPLLVRELDMSMEDGKEWKVKNVWFTQQQMPLVTLKRRQKSG